MWHPTSGQSGMNQWCREKESVGDQATWKEEGIKGGEDQEECKKFEKERERKERRKREEEEEKKRENLGVANLHN